MKRLQFVLIGAALALCGCADSGKEPAPGPESARNSTLREAVEEPLNRAREVEDISAGRKAQLDQEIEGAEE
jgi:hypothetical protein